ncbi:hypothetical protein [Flammeovirga pacifica]|uniref:Uncharacterized protein n=1 Tax=Flammeovirga pacifica TaxID=915059 RepID=A0A1S1YT45_FLAPC|nr:hypothetical protein [Flammeovirga pacifica]OHX64202.1 hypothetical protein NH26_21600 [Flammeovirga pacifica]
MKYHIYKIVVFLFVFGGVFVPNTFAQDEDEATKREREQFENVDYKKYFPIIKPNADFKITEPALHKLKKIIRYQPLEVNPLFQVSEYYFQRINDFDVLQQYQALHSTCDSALRYIDLFENQLTEKEVKKKWKKYYMEFLQFPANKDLVLEKVTLIEIKNELNRRREVLTKQKTEVDSIYINFKECINEYLIANKYFREVCGTYPTIKELYILAENDAVFDKMLPIKEHYLKSLEAFERYNQALKVHPMKGYTTEVIEEDILNYRIHGLTTNSFLEGDIKLWNYADWYDQTLDYYRKEILPMRELVINYDHYLNSVLKEKENSTIPSEDQFYLDIRKIGKIKKYDPNAYPVNIFEYKEQKINLLNQISYSNILNSGQKGDLKYIRSQADIWTECRKAIDKLDHINTNKESLGYKKHAQFFTQEYNDELSNYVGNQRAEIDITQTNAEVLLKNIIVDYFSTNPSDSVQFIPYQKDSISLEVIQETDSLVVRKINTLYTRPNKNNHTLLIGTIKDKNQVNIFVADIDSANEINWLTKHPLNTKDYQGNASIDIPSITVKGGAIHLMVSLQGIKKEKTSIEIDNQVILVDTRNGNLMNEIPMLSKKYPRVFEYLQESKSYLIGFKGDSKLNIQEYDTLTIQNIKIDGEILWNTNLLMQGMLTEIIALPTQYLIVANINKLSNMTGSNTLIAENSEFGNFNTAILKLDTFGKAVNGTVLKSSQPYETIFALSDYDNTLNLIGVKGNFSTTKDYNTRELMLINMRINNFKVEEKNIQ